MLGSWVICIPRLGYNKQVNVEHEHLAGQLGLFNPPIFRFTKSLRWIMRHETFPYFMAMFSKTSNKGHLR